MNRRLRSWHLRWFVVLAVLLPAVLFLALRDRPTVPRVDELPTASTAEAGS